MNTLIGIGYEFHGFQRCVPQSSMPRTQVEINACLTLNQRNLHWIIINTALVLHSNTSDFASTIHMQNWRKEFSSSIYLIVPPFIFAIWRCALSFIMASLCSLVELLCTRWISSYIFLTNAGTPQRKHWGLDGIRGFRLSMCLPSTSSQATWPLVPSSLAPRITTPTPTDFLQMAQMSSNCASQRGGGRSPNPNLGGARNPPHQIWGIWGAKAP